MVLFMASLCQRRTSFCMGHISRKLDGFLLMFPTGYLLSLCTVFDFVSSNIDEVLSINPSANVFIFGNFNVHHKDWQTYSGVTDRPGELCYNFSISNDLTQMVSSHSPALSDFFLSSDASVCSIMAFPPFGDSDHIVVSVSFDFPTNLIWDAPFLHSL